MRITCDLSADAAYIYLMPIKSGEATKTCPCVPSEMDGMINLDFNAANQLVGVEIQGASIRLPAKLLESAEIIG